MLDPDKSKTGTPTEMGTIETLTLALGGAWASGINLYATVLIFGLLDVFGVVDLPPGLKSLSSFWVIALAAMLYAVEFVADKIPGVDSIWDIIQSFVRIPGGALIAAGALGGFDAGLGGDIQTIAALVAGGAIATGSHATKAGTRAVINTSPEPFTNWTASILEDIAVFAGVTIAVVKPVVFGIAFVIFVLLMIWILPKIWRGIKRVFGGARHPVATARAGRDAQMLPAQIPQAEVPDKRESG